MDSYKGGWIVIESAKIITELNLVESWIIFQWWMVDTVDTVLNKNILVSNSLLFYLKFSLSLIWNWDFFFFNLNLKLFKFSVWRCSLTIFILHVPWLSNQPVLRVINFGNPITAEYLTERISNSTNLWEAF